MKRLIGIERLRAVAIAMVYLIHAHAYGYLRPLSSLGTWAGVDLFFVISGFVVTRSLQKQLPERPRRSFDAPVSAREGRAVVTFYARRFFRLAPVASLALVLHFAGAAFGSNISQATPFGTLKDWTLETAAVMTGFYNFFAPCFTRPPMAFFWSLSVEEQFYALLPVVFILATTRRARVLSASFVALAVALVIRPLFSPNVFATAHYLSPFRFDSLAVGVLLGLESERVARVVGSVPALLRRATVVSCLAALVYVSRHTDIWFAIHDGLVLIAIASALLVACAAYDGRDVLDVPLLNRTLEYVGSRSYALYVVHTAFLFFDETLVEGAGPRARHVLVSPWGETARFIGVAALVLVVAELAHRFVEKPAIEAGKRWVARREALATVTGAVSPQNAE